MKFKKLITPLIILFFFVFLLLTEIIVYSLFQFSIFLILSLFGFSLNLLLEKRYKLQFTFAIIQLVTFLLLIDLIYPFYRF